MRWAFLVALLLAGVWLLGREVLMVGEARRTGANPIPLFRRLRRRTKAFVLLVVLYVLVFFHEDFSTWGAFDLRTRLLYFGACFITLGWVLLLAARDARATALEALEEGHRLTREVLQESITPQDPKS